MRPQPINQWNTDVNRSILDEPKVVSIRAGRNVEIEGDSMNPIINAEGGGPGGDVNVDTTYFSGNGNDQPLTMKDTFLNTLALKSQTMKYNENSITATTTFDSLLALGPGIYHGTFNLLGPGATLGANMPPEKILDIATASEGTSFDMTIIIYGYLASRLSWAECYYTTYSSGRGGLQFYNTNNTISHGYVSAHCHCALRNSTMLEDSS